MTYFSSGYGTEKNLEKNVSDFTAHSRANLNNILFRDQLSAISSHCLSDLPCSFLPRGE